MRERTDAVMFVDPTTDRSSSHWRFADVEHGTSGGAADEFELATLIALVSAEPAVKGMWRARQVPFSSPDDHEGRWVYLVEVDGTELTIDPATMSTALERSPVEVATTGGGVSPYQRMIRAYGELVWAATPEPVLTVARTFDGVHDDGSPFFAPDHPRIDDAGERARLLAYLRSAPTIVTTTATARDVAAPERGAVVPLNFRTDGVWIWPDTIEYYLEQHRYAPDSRLLAHIGEGKDKAPPLDGVAIHRATAALFRKEG